MLLHTCCGVCALACLPVLQSMDINSPILYWYNPNVQPYAEHIGRYRTYLRVADDENLSTFVQKGYPLRAWLMHILSKDPAQQCNLCVLLRLNRCALEAKKLRIKEFSTTLLCSPYQDREMILRVGAEVAEKHNVTFVPFDARPAFGQAQTIAKERHYYRQKYCGCVFSEAERFSS